MAFEKLIKFMVLFVGVLILYFRDYYYLIVIVGVVFLVYKFDIHNKIYKQVNNITGRTNKVVNERNKKNRFLKKMFRNGGGEI